MNKIVTALLLGAALIFGIAGCHGLESLDLMSESNDHNSVTQSQLTDLQKQIDTLKEQLAAIEPGASDETINGINTAIANLQNDLDQLQRDFSALDSQVATDNATIAARLDELVDAVDQLSDRVGVLEGALAKVPQANAPLFVSVVPATGDEFVTETYRSFYFKRDPGVTVVWTASAGGVTATSYNVWAVVVNEDGSLGIPQLLGNGVGNQFTWNGHFESVVPYSFFSGSNPVPLSVQGEGGDRCKPTVYRFAVTAVDENGNQSAPSVTADAVKVTPTPPQED